MINKLIKKIWFICLWLTSLTLTGCFHIPDEDWLPSKNNINTWEAKTDEMEEAINSFIDWIDIISSERNEINNDEKINIDNGDIIDETWSKIIETWDTINEMEIIVENDNTLANK